MVSTINGKGGKKKHSCGRSHGCDDMRCTCGSQKFCRSTGRRSRVADLDDTADMLYDSVREYLAGLEPGPIRSRCSDPEFSATVIVHGPYGVSEARVSADTQDELLEALSGCLPDMASEVSEDGVGL